MTNRSGFLTVNQVMSCHVLPCRVMSCYVMSCVFRKRIILGLRRSFSVSKFILMTLWPCVLVSRDLETLAGLLRPVFNYRPPPPKYPVRIVFCASIFTLYIYKYIYMDKWNVLCKFINENSFVSDKEGGIRFRFTEENTTALTNVQFYSHKAWVNVSTFRCNRIKKRGFIFCFSVF